MKWAKEEIKYLKDNYSSNKNMREMCETLNRSVRAMQHKAGRINLSRPRFKSNKPSKKQSRKIIDKRYYENNREKVYRRKMKRRKTIKEEAVKMLGGKCSICGYNKCLAALDFHHERGDKEGNLHLFLKNESRQKTLKEAEKCRLLCANCHREMHHLKGQ